ncbi:MAG: hypothetical protein R6W90_05525 [Ignavibacteriaceae bacterium]
MLKPFFLFFIILLINGCDKGIAPIPEDERSGFGGTINFIGEWPDGVTRTHLVVFQNPLNSAADFNAFNLKYLGMEIPFGTSSISYSSLDSALVSIGPGSYSYVAVAQSKTPVVSLDRKDWFVVGVYYSAGNTSAPGTLMIPEKSFVSDININCNFNNLPPQPPGGN